MQCVSLLLLDCLVVFSCVVGSFKRRDVASVTKDANRSICSALVHIILSVVVAKTDILSIVHLLNLLVVQVKLLLCPNVILADKFASLSRWMDLKRP